MLGEHKECAGVATDAVTYLSTAEVSAGSVQIYDLSERQAGAQ